MFYVYANGRSIFQPLDDALVLIAPKLTLEIGKAGSLSFQIPPNHRYYNSLGQLTTKVSLEMNDDEIFRGRVLSNDMGMNKVRTIYCEGDLAYLVDTVQKAEKYHGGAHELFRKIISEHNRRADASKRFEVGDITIEDRDVLLTGSSDETQDEETGEFDYRQIAINSIAGEWQNSYEFIESCLLEYTGGYLRTRSQNGITYIDLLVDYGQNAVQSIEFGKNMLDLTEEISAEDIFTVLIPLGDENLTIESVNNGSDELVDQDAVSRYGRIVRTHVFDGVNTPDTLLENGRRFLKNHTNMPVTLTIKAVDMNLIDPNEIPIRIGDRVRVISAPHGMQNLLVCTKIEYDFDNPSNNTYTFGTPRASLTERYRKDKAKQQEESKNSGGGGGSAAEEAVDEAKEKLDEFFDAWINVSPETGHIDLGTLYKKYKDDRLTLESQCGINLDAPSGNINIKTLRKEFDDMEVEVSSQHAYIDLINNELGAKIELVAGTTKKLENRQVETEAAFTTRSNEQEAAINANAKAIVTLNGRSTASEANISQLANDVQAEINARTSFQNITNGKITTMSTNIAQVSNSLNSLITLEATHNEDNKNSIASIQLVAKKNESAITLKADKTTLDSKIVEVKGDISAVRARLITIEAVEAKINEIVATKISAIQSNLGWIEGKNLNLKYGLTASYVNVSGNIKMGSSLVVTENSLTTILNNYATKSWVTDILASYAKASHIHSWIDIANKPSRFQPDYHTHRFSFELANGHYHKYYDDGKEKSTGGIINNASHKYSGTTSTNS